MTDDGTTPSALTRTTLDALTLDAPDAPRRRFDAEHGHMWQWVPQRGPLISMTVAVRTQTRLADPEGVRGHLLWELRRHREAMDIPADAVLDRALPVHVAGAMGIAAAGAVEGIRSGVRMHNRVVVTTDGADMYVVHVAAVGTDEGRRIADELTAGLALS